MTEGLLQPASGPDPKIGMVLQDRYRIVRKLGEGGMGAVYEGEHVLIKRRVAIKCLHGQFATNPEIVARFHREALAATSIGHQNIIEVTDMGRFPDGSVFMVLEFLEGRDWSKDIDEQGPQPLAKVVKITTQICDALTAAHAKGIIHRDLKPENVFLIARGGDPDFVKVLDFGISKFKDSGGPGKGMTQTGTTLGTPYYMAPEQAQGKKDVDHRADIYSLGVMTFQALTGQYPFDDESYPMLVLKICTEPPPPLRLYRPDLPKELEDVVMRMLAKDPNQRFADCQAVKVAVEPFAGMSDVPVVAADAPSTANRPPSMLGGAAHAATQTPDSLPSAPVVAAASTSGRSLTPTNATPMPAPVVPHAESVIRPPSSSKAPLLVGIGVLVALLGVGGAMMFGGVETTAATPPPVTTPPVSPEPIGATPPTPTEEGPVPPTAADTVAITINTEPADAELYLDGDRIPNPFQGRLPQSTESRRLEARKDGYRTFVQDLVLRYEQTVTLRLERGRGTDDRRASRRGTEPVMEATTTTTTRVATMVETPMVEVAITPMVEAPMVEAPPAMDPEPAMTEPPRMTDLASIML
ncbi:MAG: serine/threonine protein kinase [Sandaracinus sp.]|nr:serine/threonine protein kinase [Sandaracinus sp.]